MSHSRLVVLESTYHMVSLSPVDAMMDYATVTDGVDVA